MGMYLNSMMVYDSYREIYKSPYFVDKTLMLDEIVPRIGTAEKYICITRPRRFGKSVMANMIASFLSKGCDAKEIFSNLKIKDKVCFEQALNQYNVIFISFNRLPRRCKSYDQYINRIEDALLQDLLKTYPDEGISLSDAVWDALMKVYASDNSNRFIFILDEWDFIFHRDFVTEEDKEDYIDFLSNLLKDQPYVSLAYMTGILPIAKYSSGSELNIFLEYTMASEEMYSDYFGFTESEVDDLFSKYVSIQSEPRVSREGLRIWYNGYHTMSGERVYNPRSVVASLTNNNLGNYWTSAGPYDEIYYYINHNVAEVKDDLAQMIAGIPVPAKVSEYAATSMNLTTKDEIYSAMIVYGFLSYDRGYVSIPNKELMDKFQDMLLKETSLGYVNQLAKESGKMLKATLSGDTDVMVKILEYAHNTESPLLSYSNESDLTTVVNLVYLQARDTYRIEREDKAGIGYVDFIFYPEINKQVDGIILELKVDHTAEEALQQIKDRKYVLKFEGHLGEKPKYTGRVLGVGIAYDKNTKEHECKKEITKEYGVKLIETLTGFKYIGEQIKFFEQAKARGEEGNEYLFGYEESYGCLMGTHARDKDAVVAVMALCEVAAWCKHNNITLCDQMRTLFDTYGYYKEGLCTVTLKGQDGAKKIAEMMESIRNDIPETVGGLKVLQFRDYRENKLIHTGSDEVQETGLPKSNVLYFELEDDAWCCIRPSGTEPKIKFYIGVKGSSDADADAKLTQLTAAVENLAK